MLKHTESQHQVDFYCSVNITITPRYSNVCSWSGSWGSRNISPFCVEVQDANRKTIILYLYAKIFRGGNEPCCDTKYAQPSSTQAFTMSTYLLPRKFIRNEKKDYFVSSENVLHPPKNVQGVSPQIPTNHLQAPLL